MLACSTTELPSAPIVVVVKVCRASYARGEVALQALVTLDKPAHNVAVDAVPLGPDVPVREGADLVATAVPWLCNELDLREDGVLGDGADERRRAQQRAI